MPIQVPSQHASYATRSQRPLGKCLRRDGQEGFQGVALRPHLQHGEERLLVATSRERVTRRAIFHVHFRPGRL